MVRYLVITLILGSVLLLAVISDKPSYRYHNLNCQFNAIYNTQGDVDYVILGTSRTMQAIDPALFPSIKDDITINLARNWRGPGQLYNMLEDFSEQHSVRKGIVFEITYYNTKSYYGYFKDYGSAASWRQLIDDFNSKPRESLFTRLGDLVSLSFSKLDKALTHLIKRRVAHNLRVSHPLPKPETVGCSKGDNKYNKKRLQSDFKKFERRGGYGREKLLNWDMAAINEDRNAYYVDKIIAYSERHNITPIFVTVPRYLMNPVGDETISEFKQKHGYVLHTMTRNELYDLYKGDGYSDPGHLKDNGRITYTNWLVSAVLKNKK